MKKLLLSVCVILSLAGCKDNGAFKDPKDGKVYLESDPCDIFDCWGPYKMCVGPDLMYGIPNRSKYVYRWIKDSKECLYQ